MPEAYALSPTDILVDRSDPSVAIVTINRPQKRNALSKAMWRHLGETFAMLGKQSELKAIILTGTGNAFSAGADISEFGAVRATIEDGRIYEHTAEQAQALIASCPKATIAAITGPCYGGAVGVALSCDFRVVDRTAHMAIPAARLSNVYGIGETRALFDAVGYAAAKEVLFTGRRYDAADAHRIGLATHVADDGETALAAAKRIAQGLRTSAPLTIKGTKVILAALARAETAARKADIQAVMDEAIASEDYKEGVAAFAAKRDPVFRGR